MTQPFGPLDAISGGLFYLLSVAFMLFMIVALPLLVLAAIRFLWYRHVYIGRSAELEKLVWQLHRIASALEQQQAATPPSETPTAKPEQRPVVFSMFGR